MEGEKNNTLFSNVSTNTFLKSVACFCNLSLTVRHPKIKLGVTIVVFIVIKRKKIIYVDVVVAT